MTSYYARAFKTGVYPRITQDRLYIWSRPHAAPAIAEDESIPKPEHAEWVCVIG